MFTRSQSILLVHPLMEYACIVWDPYQITYINSLERIQQDGLHQTMGDLTVYQTYCNLLDGQC